ncbi:hypothetical protein RMATCC62417_13720 [Rhizopus microsporus]|nr:hypothetical protein RMATCC62417_13720 [Rhizopus microsporus]
MPALLFHQNILQVSICFCQTSSLFLLSNSGPLSVSSDVRSIASDISVDTTKPSPCSATVSPAKTDTVTAHRLKTSPSSSVSAPLSPPILEGNASDPMQVVPITS